MINYRDLNAGDFFRYVLSPITDEEKVLISVPNFLEISSKLPTDQKIDGLDKTQNECTQIIKKLKEGEFEITERPERFTDENEDESLTINEQAYSISYKSPFEDISSESKRRLVVSPDPKKEGENIYRTITDAINSALPGETIIVHQGVYHESIVIDRSIEIVSEKDADVEICSLVGDCVTLKTKIGRIVNVTLKCKSPGKTYCVHAKSGILELEGCKVDSNSAGCVQTDTNARLIARKCDFSSKGTATSLMPQSHTIFDSCSFNTILSEDDRNSEDISLEIGSEATCIAVDCTNIKSTVIFRSKSKGMLLRCTIRDVKGNGILIQEGATPLIKECRITNCMNSGIQFSAGSMGTVSNSKLKNNEKFGILVLASEKFSLTNNTISFNKQCGIRIAQGSKGHTFGNKIRNNDTGIRVESACNVRVKKDSIYGNKSVGLFVKRTGDRKTNTRVSVNSATFRSNNVGAICENCISEFINTLFEDNETGLTITEQVSRENDMSDATYAEKTAMAAPQMTNSEQEQYCSTLKDCKFNLNRICHLKIQNNCQANVSNSTFSEFFKNSIILLSKSDSTFTNCIFENTNAKECGSAIMMKDFSKCKVIDSAFKTKLVSVKIVDNAVFESIKSIFTDSATAIIVQGGAILNLRETNIKNNKIGILVREGSTANIAFSSFLGCIERAIFADGKGTQLNMSEHSTIQASGKECVHISDGATANFSDVTFIADGMIKSKSDFAIVARKAKSVNLSNNCHICNFGIVGIDVNDAEFTCMNSEFRANAQYHIKLVKTEARIHANMFCGGLYSAILVGTGVDAKDKSNIEVLNNVFEEFRSEKVQVMDANSTVRGDYTYPK